MVREAAAHCSKGYGQQRAGALAEPKAEVEQRRELERGKGCGVRRLGRPVAGLPPGPGAGSQPLGDQGRRTGDHAVEDDRGTALGGAAEKACHRGKVGSADDAHQSGRVVEVGPSAPSGIAYGTGLADPAGVVDAGAAADQGVRLARRSAERSARSPAWCCRCPCRRRPAGRRRRRSPRRRWRGPRRAPVPSPRRSSASSRSMRPLPALTLCRVVSAGRTATSVATARSATRTVAPTWAASALTAAPPARKLATICAVTSLG